MSSTRNPTDAVGRTNPYGLRKLNAGTLAVAGLILIALQTEIKLPTYSEGHWRFTFHKKPMKDSTLGTLAAKMFGAFTPKP